MNALEGKVAIATGGGQGIGLGINRALLDAVGKLAVYLAGDDSNFITGQVIVIDGGRTSKLPLPF